MSSLYARGNRLWCRLKTESGRWISRSTPYNAGDEHKAKRYAEAAQRKLDTRRAAGAPVNAGPLTLRDFVKVWLPKRREADLDWRNDESRLRHHVLPVIGDIPIADIRASHIVTLVHALRTNPAKRLAPRTIHNIYSVIAALLRDAELADVIDRAPVSLDERQLGPLIDADPEWRSGSLFTRDEAEILISDARIPPDRQLVYAFGLLAGMRPGEAAALRWRHYDPTAEPLGRLTVALAYNTRKNRTKGTKTEAVRAVPVHPALAAMLAEWKLSGWQAQHGRAPGPDDLIVPLPPAAAVARRTRAGEPFRGTDYSFKRWSLDDLPTLGWRYREPYATKATFITLAIEDGADKELIEKRVTHSKPRRSAFDGYDRGPHWIATCAEVAKLQITRRSAPSGEVIALPIAACGEGGFATVLATAENSSVKSDSKEWRRRESNPRPKMCRD